LVCCSDVTGRRAVMFVRHALKVAMQNEGDFVGVILLYSVCIILTVLRNFKISMTLSEIGRAHV
jgi:hypothetical protein